MLKQIADPYGNLWIPGSIRGRSLFLSPVFAGAHSRTRLQACA